MGYHGTSSVVKKCMQSDLDRKCSDCDVRTLARVQMDAQGDDVSDMVRHVHLLCDDKSFTAQLWRPRLATTPGPI